MLVLPPRAITLLAERIRLAYVRRRPHLHREYAHSRVWTDAASVLIALCRSDPVIPIDPELYVASQLQNSGLRQSDPWTDLVHPSATERYRHQIRRIIQSLRRELHKEMRVLDRRLAAGASLDQLINTPDPRISPLTRYTAALRRLGPEAALRVKDDACRQHESCPLYRQACARLLPGNAYPVVSLHADLAPAHLVSPAFSLN